MLKRSIFLVFITLAVSTGARAEAAVCEYRPSVYLGSGVTAASGGAAASVASIGPVASQAGIYTLVHSTSGATMLGGTWAGTSAAGTAGIIGGTGTGIGAAFAWVTWPVIAIPAAIAAVSVGAFEGACYFTDTRITEYNEVNAIVKDIAVTANAYNYQYFSGPSGDQDDFIMIRNTDDEGLALDRYDVSSLYIVNGVLMHRDWGPNTNLGILAHIQTPPSAAERSQD